MTKQESDFWWQVKGVCIFAVIAIHAWHEREITLIQVFVRQFINFPVILFVFMSGYFVNTEHVENDWKSWILLRLKRIGIPYFMWSIIYLLYNMIIEKNHPNIKGIIASLLLGTSNIQMYYCIVLIQLVILTPILVKYINSAWMKWICAVVSLAVLMLRYVYEWNHSISGILFQTCGIWLFFYYYGIYKRIAAKNNRIALKIKYFIAGMALIVSFVESFMMYFSDIFYTYSISQTKLGNLLLGVCIIEILCDKSTQTCFRTDFFYHLGKISFEIYLLHMLVLEIVLLVVSNITYVTTIVYTLTISTFLVLVWKKARKGLACK